MKENFIEVIKKQEKKSNQTEILEMKELIKMGGMTTEDFISRQDSIRTNLKGGGRGSQQTRPSTELIISRMVDEGHTTTHTDTWGGKKEAWGILKRTNLKFHRIRGDEIKIKQLKLSIQ